MIATLTVVAKSVAAAQAVCVVAAYAADVLPHTSCGVVDGDAAGLAQQFVLCYSALGRQLQCK